LIIKLLKLEHTNVQHNDTTTKKLAKSQNFTLSCTYMNKISLLTFTYSCAIR